MGNVSRGIDEQRDINSKIRKKTMLGEKNYRNEEHFWWAHQCTKNYQRKRDEFDERPIEFSPAEMWKENAKSNIGHQSQWDNLSMCNNVLCSVTSVVSDSLRPMDSSPPGFSVHDIFQARRLESVIMPSSRGSSQCRNQAHISGVSCIPGRFFTQLATWEAH